MNKINKSKMKKNALKIVCLLFVVSCSSPRENSLKNLEDQLVETIELFGHRNWIVVADAAYPEQSHPAIKTIKVNASQLETVELVNKLIDDAAHVDANVFIDKEMAFVSEENALGIDAYRTELYRIIEGKNVKTLLHEDIIRELDASAELFNILIIKTDLTLPYTSVFFQLECGYWNAESEAQLRNKMNNNE